MTDFEVFTGKGAGRGRQRNPSSKREIISERQPLVWMGALTLAVVDEDGLVVCERLTNGQTFAMTFSDAQRRAANNALGRALRAGVDATIVERPVEIPAGPPCDPELPSAESPQPHDYEHIDDEYDSLGNGGSYEVLQCRACRRVAYRALPD